MTVVLSTRSTPANAPLAVATLQPVAGLLSPSIRTLTVVVAANDAGSAKLSAARAEAANNRALLVQWGARRLLRWAVSQGAAAPENVG